MGIVYKGRDRLLNRDVALKALPFVKSSETGSQHILRQRFEREAQSASALNHPNIVTIYDLLSEPDSDFIVMEYVEGKSLSQVIPTHGLPLGQVVRYGLQIADAVGSAHAAGIVHRDLKPENILISRHDQIKIVDFGLAKQGSDPRGFLATQEMLTGPGSFLGTLCYAAPEQHQNLPVDQRTKHASGLGRAPSPSHSVAGREKISIAVLPFRSLSADQEDSYMAMGIGSEINSHSAPQSTHSFRVSSCSCLLARGSGAGISTPAIAYRCDGPTDRTGTRCLVLRVN